MPSIRVANSPLLLSAIFDHLEPPISSPTKKLSSVDKDTRKELRGALLSTALASRALSEHALAVLWRKLDDVRPLLILLSQFRPCYRGSDMSMLHGDITAEAWLRFQAYASRVRVLHQRTWARIHPSTWSILCRWCGHQPLLPKLEALSTLPIHVLDPVMMMFITSTLRSLRIQSLFGREVRTEDFYAVSALLRRISEIAPQITDLHVTHDDGYNALPPAFIQPLGHFKALQVFEADNAVLDLQILQCLAKLPGLQTLSAIIELDEAENEDPYELELFEESDWSSLTCLSIRGAPGDLSAFVVNICYPPTVRSLTLEVLVECWPAELAALVVRCIGAFEYEGEDIPIEEFTLRYKHEFRLKEERFTEEPQHKDSLLDIIRYSLNCSELKKATFDFTELPAVTDADLERMIEAWPKLTELHIPPSEREIFHVHSSKKVPRPTMSSLIAFARRCPQLRELSLPEVHLSTLPDQQDWPFVNHPLQVLLVGFERDRGDCLRGAEFIDRLFPHVRLRDPPPRQSFRSPYRSDRDEIPESVREYLEVMQIGRRRARELLKKYPRTDPRAGQATPASW
ncbi:hypothetical protein K466DRAFT_591642 [Polyporus arcularius HHB13444]|uniref:F-box domain-containing protein n=1 Tax=Polyporus arcularius HHB13444 TaxID=1314778 RepID=A0A5C3NVK3_9APHY|nr:hypothetical protein K466DRAFT_591642 [Polyporus arcularius HHB13444]